MNGNTFGTDGPVSRTWAVCCEVDCEVEVGPGWRSPQPRHDVCLNLEQQNNNPTRWVPEQEVGGSLVHPTGAMMLSPHRCRCRTCPTCGDAMGTHLRMRLHEKVEAGLFSVPKLLTLTVDRDGTTVPLTATHHGFTSPDHAHEVITSGGYIARLMRSFGIKVWVAVLEFQTKSGDGWPHWHLLVDLADLPGHWLDYAKLQRLWHEKWGIGRPNVSEAKLANPAHAINYATKYLTKQPDGGYPEWVLNSRRVRFISASKAVGRLVSPEDEDDPTPDEAGDEVSPNGPVRPLIERMGECCESTRVWMETVDRQTGEIRMKLAGFLSVDADTAGVLCRAAGMDVQRSEDDLGRVGRLVRDTSYEQLRKLIYDEDHDASSSFRLRVQAKKRHLLDSNRFVQRAASQPAAKNILDAS